MNDHGDRGASRAGCALGFLCGATIFGLIGFPMVFGLLWGGAHCEPVPACQRAGEQRFIVEILVLLFLSILFGLAVRWAATGFGRRRRNDDAEGAAAPGGRPQR